MPLQYFDDDDNAWDKIKKAANNLAVKAFEKKDVRFLVVGLKDAGQGILLEAMKFGPVRRETDLAVRRP